MQLRNILNLVEKQKGFVYESAIFSADKKSILVGIRPSAGSRPICSGCGCHASGYDRLTERRFEFVPLWGLVVDFVDALRRVNCTSCGVKVERVPGSDDKHRTTYSYRLFLATWAKRLSWKETAKVFGTSWDTVYRSIRWVVGWGLKHREIGAMEAIGIDEISYRRGHKYVTLVYQIDAGMRRLLYVAQNRTEASLHGIFDQFPSDSLRTLKYICTDMWRQYMNVIAAWASHVVQVFDRFHVMKKLNEKIDKVRAEEARRLKEQGQGEILKYSRWCLLKNPDNLTDRQAIKLKELVRLNLRTVRAYLMREDFQRFWEYVSPSWAGRFMDQWCVRAMRSKIDPMKEMASTLRRHREILLNSFRARGEISNGSVEGMNNKAKLAIKKAYGFKSYKTLETALYHQLSNLPEPKTTHKFC